MPVPKANLWIGIMVAAVIVFAYYAGRGSGNAMTAPQTTSATVPITTSYSIQQSSTPASLEAESADGLACKNIAYSAVSAEQLRTNRLTTVLQSHYNQILGQCYYEELISISLSGTAVGGDDTLIKSASDDDWIAECSSGVLPPPGLFCTQHYIGVITEQQFKQLETKYLTN
jgi:hypothetical protein